MVSLDRNDKKSPQSGGERIDRRDFLKLLGIGGLSLLPTILETNRDEAIERNSHPAKAHPKSSYGTQSRVLSSQLAGDFRNSPNIIFILGDNHHYQTMGCAGHPFIQTPGMDRLAREGVLFENTFCTTPLCSPSRASILTGTYAHKHGVKNNHTPWKGTYPTFLEDLSQHGYATAFIGKWHMPGEGLPEFPFLDQFVSYTYREGQGAYFDCPLIVNGVEVKSQKSYITEEITNYAMAFLESNQFPENALKRPFCLFLGHRPGHSPYQSPADLKGLYKGENVEDILPDHIDPWWYGKANRNVFEGVMMGSYYDQYRKYCETLTAMDRDILRLLEYLDVTGLSENTVVIYMGDNGMQWGTHNCHGIREPYEDSIRLPLIVRAPWITPSMGMRDTHMVLNIDVAPTLLDFAGIPIPQGYDGRSLVPFLRGETCEWREDFLLEFWRYFPENTPSYRGVRSTHHKFIEFERGRDPLLFDLADDPGERINLYGTSSGQLLLKGLKSRMENYLA
jgi:N-acetylglucosamine-6-sulfatase